jgi:hypothetical protein
VQGVYHLEEDVMSVTFPPLRVGEPLSYEALSVFPLLADAPEDRVEYRLADEALAEKSLAVEGK